MDSPDSAHAGHDLFTRHEARLADLRRDVTLLVLILREDLSVADRFAAAFPEAEVHALDTRARDSSTDVTDLHPRVHHVGAPEVADRVSYVAARERPQLILDAGNPERHHRLGNLRHLFFLLEPGGFYIVDDLAYSGDAQLDESRRATLAEVTAGVKAASMSVKARQSAKLDVAEFARSIASASFTPGSVRIEKAHRHLYKLREWEADDALRQRYGDAWGRTLVQRPAGTFVSRARLASHGDGPIAPQTKTFAVPPRRLREYVDVVCAGHQVAIHRDFVLPDTFRHPHQRVLAHRRLVYANSTSARLRQTLARQPQRFLAGSYFFFDSEYPGHFGHVTTEVLSRVWGWHEAVRHDPAVRPILTGCGTPPQLPAFQREILAASGVPVDQTELIADREVVRVERLFAATPQFENPHYVDPDIQRTWRQLRDGLPLEGPGETPRRIFVTRTGSKRVCHQQREVEGFFREHGFVVLLPETLPFVEQARLFAGAEVIAGFGGSGMLTMLLAPDARIVVVSGDGYDAENEHLVAAVNGNDLHYFWGVSDLQTSSGHTQLAAARSDFTFDLDRHRRALERVIG